MSAESITECLFFRAYNSFLLQRESFTIDFSLLLDQYRTLPESFKILDKNNLLRFKQMQHAFKTGSFNLFEGTIKDFTSLPLPILTKSSEPHKKFVHKIYEHRETTLIPFTGPIDDICPEYPIVYGNIDLLAYSGLCAFIIEIKTEMADHSIVGQAMKYWIGLSLKLQLKFFNDIKVITLCPGYDTPAYNGLRQIGATPLIIDPVSMKVSRFL